MVFRDQVRDIVRYELPRALLVVAVTLVLAYFLCLRGADFTVEDKTTRGFTVVDKTTGVGKSSPPERQYWQGFGWVEKRDGHWWKVESGAPEVARRPFSQAVATPGTTAPPVVSTGVPTHTSSAVQAPSPALTYTLVPGAGRAGFTSPGCSSFG